MRFNAKEALLKEVAATTKLSNSEKLRIRLAIALRPRLRQEILGEVTAACCEGGCITEDEMMMTGIDLAKIKEIIEKLLPLILKLIDLFS